MTKTLCIDGNSLLKQSYHVNKISHTDEWGNINSVLTFLTISRMMIRNNNIEKVIIFWDSPNAGKLRYDIYPHYKSNRKKSWHTSDITLTDSDIRQLTWLQKNNDEDAILLMQKLRIQQYAEELYFRQYEYDKIESDDAIAYYCKNIKDKDEEVIIYTNDRDFLQLLEIDNVNIYLSNLKQIITKYNFSILYFNYHYENSALIKAIEGCKSDIIYGVDGVGEKSLLKYFPELRTRKMTIDEIFLKAEEINSNRKKPLKCISNLLEGKTAVKLDNILNGEHLYKLNYKLVNLLEPMITKEAIEDLILNTTTPLDIEDRGGKNIIRLMESDGLMKKIPRGVEGYKDFLTAFLPVVNSEKRMTLKG